MDAVGLRSMYFVVLPRVNLIVIIMTYVCLLYPINCPTIICLPSILLFILWRDTTSELWTLVQFLYIAITILLLLALFTFLKTITFYHSIRLILCSQQTNEIDNLTVSWDKLLGCVVWRFHVAIGEKLHADAARCWCRSPSSWEPQEEGMMSTVANFPSVRNQG
jgi:energy-coupling factor transporter transmembrane protein EcfT